MFGGSTRIPRIQSLLKQYMGRYVPRCVSVARPRALSLSETLDQNLNGDEAAAFGSVFHAADLHPSFRVRSTSLTDLSSFPIGVRLTDLEPDAVEADASASVEDVKREPCFLFWLVLRVSSALRTMCNVQASRSACPSFAACPLLVKRCPLV